MKLYIIDTHIYVAFVQNDVSYLSPLVKTIFHLYESNECTFYVPTICFWEITYKILWGSLKIKGYSSMDAIKVVQRPLEDGRNFKDLLLTRRAAALAPSFRTKLPDPFDQLIVASALDANLPLITKDQNIQKSRLIQVVW